MEKDRSVARRETQKKKMEVMRLKLASTRTKVEELEQKNFAQEHEKDALERGKAD